MEVAPPLSGGKECPAEETSGESEIKEVEPAPVKKPGIIENLVGELAHRDMLSMQKAAESSSSITRIMRGDGANTADSKSAAAPHLSEFIAERKCLYDQVVGGYPTKVGKAVSKRERDELGKGQATLVYGEVNFESFAIAFDKIKSNYGLPGQGSTPPGGILQRPGGKFYDLGSGIGKPSVAAACLHPFAYVGGVEILEGLFK
jgi:hypothetical protein